MTAYMRIILFPFSLIYLIIIIIRNLLYDKGILKIQNVSKPVISIGNITTGGTGKSPFTIFLAEFLINKNIKPAIVSRGYKRKSNEIEIVYDGKVITSLVDKCGDEPMMMANNLSLKNKDFFIVTGSNRVETCNYIINKFNPDIIILDDAYQHRKIERDLDIVLIDAEDMTTNKLSNSIVLPAGNLRENFGNLSGADIIIQNNKFHNIGIKERLKKFGKNVFILNYRVKGFYDINNNQFDIKGKNFIGFSGIAKPESFLTQLLIINNEYFSGFYKFKDHHRYTEDDIRKITKDVSKETIFITTEKDFVKIKHFKDFLKNFNVLFMKIELNLEGSDKFFDVILNKILNKNIIDNKKDK